MFYKEIIAVRNYGYLNTLLTSMTLVSRDTAKAVSRVDVTPSPLTVYRTRP